MAGATIANVWKQRLNVSSGLADDAQAPFALGTVSLITPPAGTNRTVAKFCRVGATGIAAGATAGIGTDGITAAAAGGNTWTNDTGVALVTGDYAWLTTGQVTVLAEGASTITGANFSGVWRLANPDDEPAYPLDLVSVITPPGGTKRSLGKFTLISGEVEPGAEVGDWTNDTGVVLKDGDYVWLTKEPEPTEAEAGAAAAAADQKQKAAPATTYQ
jgi:hypothetical protein